MKKQFIELDLSEEISLWVLSGDHIFMIHTQFLIDRGEMEFHDELDNMTEDILTLGAKINKIKGKAAKLRLIEEEYRCLIFAIQYCACLFLTDEGEAWFRDEYFPRYGLEEIRQVKREDMQRGYLRFADSFLSKNPSLPAFMKIKKEVATRMDELFPLEN